MKRLIIIFTLLSLLFLCSCNPSPSQLTEYSDGVITRTTTHDFSGRVIQEITYNSTSCLTIITFYTYAEDNGHILVTNVTTIILDAEGNRIE